MMRTSVFILALSLSGPLAFSAPAEARQEACKRSASVADAKAAIEQVETLNEADCLGGRACESDVCKKVKPAFDDKATRDQIAVALRAVLAEAQVAAAASDNGKRLLARILGAIERYDATREAAAAEWSIVDYVFFPFEPDEIHIRQWLTDCTGPADCTRVTAEAERVIELATLIRRILNEANQAKRAKYIAFLATLDQQWRAYLASSRGQYPWELALNSAIYRKTAQFDAPPRSQLIVAHPGAGYELTRDASDRQPSESLLLEAFGIYRWKWQENKMKQRLGGSATLAWRDAGDGRNKLGYGVLVYLPRSSTIGYVWRPQDGGDEHALVLSADLVKFIRGTDGIKARLLNSTKQAGTVTTGNGGTQ